MKLGKKGEPEKSILFSRPVPKKAFSGKTPNILIGSYGYPEVNVGALVDEENNTTIDNPKFLAKTNRDINNILTQRQSLINSQLKVRVKDIKHKFAQTSQDIAKSALPVDSEVQLEKPLSLNASFYDQAMPHGPSALLKKMDLTSNPKIPKHIESATSDSDVKAQTVMDELGKKGFDEYYLTRLLSTGTLGIDRKIVPTKWAITAVDDNLAKELHKQILDFPDANYALHTGNYLGNYYIILIIPGDWSFELIEYVHKGTIYNQGNDIIVGQDHEFAQGRKKYAENTTGGYYAARLPILQFLKKHRKQGRVIIFRTITEEYTVPLGVWVVREGVRNSLNKPVNSDEISDSESLLRAAKKEAKKLNIADPDKFINLSIVLKEEQKSLKRWF
ncbi:hypothetical protein K9M74_01720 [Candidatus Woesearchaeota archaeon]|nr:hypothetical protein [Candidatus Woesearchaeota archaeon]